MRCVTSRKSTYLIYFAVEAWNRAVYYLACPFGFADDIKVIWWSSVKCVTSQEEENQKHSSEQNCAGTKRLSLKCTAGMGNIVWRFGSKKLGQASVCPSVGCANSRTTERLSITADIINPDRNWPRVLDLPPGELRKRRFVWSVRPALCDFCSK